MNRGLKAFQTCFMNGISHFQTADIPYIILQLIKAVENWNKKPRADYKFDICFYDIQDGLSMYKGIDEDSGAIIISSVSEQKKQKVVGSDNETQAIKPFKKVLSGLRHLSSTNSDDKYKRILILAMPDFLDFADPSIWLSMKKSLIREDPISFIMMSNHRSGIPRFMSRYISYPNISELLNIGEDRVKERKEEIESLLKELSIEKESIEFDIEDRINPMTTSEFKNLSSMMKLLPTNLENGKRALDKKEIIESIDYVTKSAWRELAKSNNLELVIDNNNSFSKVGGLDALKDDMKEIAIAFKDRKLAEQHNVPVPKAILLQGVQGAGKTLMASAIAREFGSKFAIFNFANIFSGRLGDTEANIQAAINTMTELAPIVVLVDEVEKALAGVGSSDKSDAGTTARAYQTYLAYMASDHKGVFLVHTANDLDQMHPDFLRKGRLDQIYFIDFPVDVAREEIFKIHMKKVGTSNETITAILKDGSIIKKSEHYTGAEIEAAVAWAKRKAFVKNREDPVVTKELIIAGLDDFIPIAVTEKEKIDHLREWGNSKAKPASSTSIKITKGTKIRKLKEDNPFAK